MISVIMSVWNVDKYIARAVMSVISQTYEDFELLIIDDGSTDKTLQIINAIQDKRIRLFKNPQNIGVYKSRNHLLSVSKGDYITWLDGDDYFDKTLFEKQVWLLKNEATKAVRVLYTRVDKRGVKIYRPMPAYIGIMFKAEVFKKIGFFHELRFGADAEYLARIKKVFGDKSIGQINELLYYAIMRKDNITATQREGSTLRNEYGNDYTKWHNEAKNLYMKQGDMPFQINPRLL